MRMILNDEYKNLRELYQLYFLREDYDSHFLNGHFWEQLKKFERKSEFYCLDFIKKQEKEIYVMWDTLDSYGGVSESCWNYPRYSILCMSVFEFFEQFSSFPEDLYVFDDSMNWSIIFTHEDYRVNKRYCLEASS